MISRLSSTQITDSSLLGIKQTYSRFSEAESKVNTGKQLLKPSDNPAGTAQTLEFRERVAELDQFSRNNASATNFLSTSESALDSVTSLTRQARTLGVQAANGTVSPETQTALAGQIENIITQIANIANTTYGSQYVFAGQLTDTAPVLGTPSGFIYTGGTATNSNADLTLDIGRNESIKINTTADQVFIPLLTTLGKLRDDVATNASSVISRIDLTQVDTQLNTVLTARADIGSKINRLTLTQTRNEVTKDNYTKFISNIEDADIPSAAVELQTAQTAYQAALTATSRSFQNSLLDFLK